MSTSKVSVIVPIYNSSSYLKKCISCLIHQKYSNLEILLIDDGSTDNSYELCKSYSKKDARIKVFTKKNEGLGITRNYGIKKSTGEYIMFLDPDDYIDNNYILDVVNNMLVNNLDIGMTNYKYFYLDKNLESGIQRNYLSNSDFLCDTVYNNNRNFYIISSCMNIYKRNIIVNNDIFFLSEREWLSEDIIFNLEYCNYAKRFMIISGVYYYYTQLENSNSLTHTYREDRFEKSKKLNNKLIELSKKYNYYNNTKDILANMFFSNVRFCIKQEFTNSNKYIQRIKKIINDKQILISYKDKGYENIKRTMFDWFVVHKKINIILFLETINKKIKSII